MKKWISLLCSLLVCSAVNAAISRHVEWRAQLVPDAGDSSQATLELTAVVENGWHIYGLEMPDVDLPGMPDPTTIVIDSAEGLVTVDMPEPSIAPTIHVDPTLDNAGIPWLSGEFTISQSLRLNGVEGARVIGFVRYMACNDVTCTAPAKFEFDLPFGNAPQAAAPASSENAAAAPAMSNADSRTAQWWAPVEIDAQAQEAQSFWMILLMGFIGGLVALLTPCIWPMIPMTVSFFLKRTKSKRKAIGDAITYAVSILIIFLTLGILLTLLFGPGKMNEIATGAVFNLIFFAMLVFFAISFFGAFEITLPSKWTNATDAWAGRLGGFFGIFFMAFTLVLVSFSCTGPIIGTLLVEAFSQSNLMGPLLGMSGFALGLALPFGFFAFFPSMLKELPKSGSWLNTVKVVLGFVELILSLKFLSVADLAYGWHILDREVFLSIWIVLFILLGVYLLGKIQFPHDDKPEKTSVGRFFMALISLAFAVYLIPGLWGAPLKAVSAFAPPLYTQDFNLYGGEFHAYDDYDEGMAAAARQGKPVLVDFSGYACVNCRKMEGAVFDTPAVRGIIEQDYVMITLMVDDKANLPEPITVEEEGRTVRLTTVGDKWSYLQRHKFATNQQPFYVILDNQGQPLAGSRAHDENVGAFVGWLEDGIQNYRNPQ